MKNKYAKIRISFKSPDAIYEILANLPDDQAEKFSNEYFEFGDYGMFEFDAKTLTAKLVPIEDW